MKVVKGQKFVDFYAIRDENFAVWAINHHTLSQTISLKTAAD